MHYAKVKAKSSIYQRFDTQKSHRHAMPKADVVLFRCPPKAITYTQGLQSQGHDVGWSREPTVAEPHDVQDPDERRQTFRICIFVLSDFQIADRIQAFRFGVHRVARAAVRTKLMSLRISGLQIVIILMSLRHQSWSQAVSINQGEVHLGST
jgi:hypothetical protein